jgi:hypothetical protein
MWRTLSLAEPADAVKKPPEIQKNVDFSWGVKIPMRDGIHLNATVYKPKSGDPTPVIFTLTPYISDSYHDRAYYFAQHGYAFALVDCRGRGNSAGEFEPFIQEPRDGHDIVEWLATQPWCNGSVSMWGGSYAGFDQWMTLKEFPPHLRTIVPAAAAYAAVDFPFYKNIFMSYEIQWFTFTSGVTGNANLFGEQAFWIEKFREMYLNHRPFSELDQIVGNCTTHFQTWLQHPTPDAYWDRLALSPEDYDRINIPILTITGHYDGDQPGAMHYYQQHIRSGSPAREQHYLIIGPWDHAGTRTPNKEFGGLKFGDASVLDLNQLHTEWYDWILKGGPKPEFLKQRVAYYLAGAEEWKYADSLDAISNATLRLHLNSIQGYANDVFHSGTLEASPPTEAQPDTYVYDPLDVRPADLEREEIKNEFTDQLYALNLFGNGLVYHSAPFEADTEIAGFPKFVVWMSLDVPDTDFAITIFEILSDGTSIQLTWDFLRARYRESMREERLVTPGEINRYEFNGSFFSRRIAKGSRLRLLINSPNTIYLQKNYNSGGVVAAESGKDARIAHVNLYHDTDHPSYLELPLVGC